MLCALFDGPSLLSDGCYRTIENRCLVIGQQVDCYRNLNRKDCFSIRARQGQYRGLVAGYGRSVVIENPRFVISERSRHRVIQEGVKNVHAFVRGQLAGIYSGDLARMWQAKLMRVSYSPFVGNFFYQLERDLHGRCIKTSIAAVENSILERASFAIVNGRDVFLVMADKLEV